MEENSEQNKQEEKTPEGAKKMTIQEYCKLNGIPFEDTTHLYVGKTTIIMSETHKQEDDDSAETMIRNLNRRK